MLLLPCGRSLQYDFDVRIKTATGKCRSWLRTPFETLKLDLKNRSSNTNRVELDLNEIFKQLSGSGFVYTNPKDLFRLQGFTVEHTVQREGKRVSMRYSFSYLNELKESFLSFGS